MRSAFPAVVLTLSCACLLGCSEPARQSEPQSPRPIPTPPPTAPLPGQPGATAPSPPVVDESQLAMPHGRAEDGYYTEFKASPDTRIVYVSSSEGRDSNDGLTPRSPKQTIQAGLDMLRNGFPDWLLLKRGDVWTVPGVVHMDKSGRSEREMLLISAYGEGPRPQLRGYLRVGTGWRATTGVAHAAITSLHINLNHRNPKDPGFAPNDVNDALNISSGGESQAPLAIEDVLIEDVLVSFGCVVAQSGDHGEIRSRNLRFRRVVVHDCYNQHGRTSGMYFSGLDGLLIEESVVDNIQQRQMPSAVAISMDHSVYVQSTNRNVVIRRSFFTRVPDGPMMRPGGVFEENIVAHAGFAQLQGYIWGGTEPVKGGVTSRVVGNAFIDITGPGLTLGNVARAHVENNIFLKPKTDRSAIELIADSSVPDGYSNANIGVHNVELKGNIAFGYAGGGLSIAGDTMSNVVIANNTFAGRGGLGFDHGALARRNAVRLLDNRVEAVTFADPNRDLASYNKSLGGEASVDAFMRELYKQTKGNYRREYSAQAVLEYLRAGLKPR